MKNKKGFTLVELLGVIVVIGIISVIVGIIVTNSFSGSKNDLEKVQEKNVIASAKSYFNENLNKYSKEETPSSCKDTTEGDTINRVCSIESDLLVSENYIDQPKDINTKEDITYTIKISFKIDNGKIKDIKYQTGKSLVYKDPSGANQPKLASGMIPIVYDEENEMWIKADLTTEWYSYDEQKWANAVTVNETRRSYYLSDEAIGKEVSMDDINTMWVWIPRYKYRITSNIGSSRGVTSPPEIDVVFEKGTNTTGVNESTYRSEIETGTITSYYTHPAFRDGSNVYKTTAYDIGGWDKELTGIWVAKFEVRGTSTNPIIVPNTETTFSSNVSEKFITSLKFAGGAMNEDTGEVTFNGNATYGLKNTVDTHMMKNTEWGAVAYLAQSKYGKMGNTSYTGNNKEIYQNTTTKTGNSSGVKSGSTSAVQCPYNDITNRGNGTGACGAGASTTGTIYGVYDMSGGLHEYTMGNWNGSIGVEGLNNSGFNGIYTNNNEKTDGVSFPSQKYYDKYNGTQNISPTANNSILGDATWETFNWYSDNGSVYIHGSQPWTRRANGSSGASVGIFAITGIAGDSDTLPFRATLIP